MGTGKVCAKGDPAVPSALEGWLPVPIPSDDKCRMRKHPRRGSGLPCTPSATLWVIKHTAQGCVWAFQKSSSLCDFSRLTNKCSHLLYRAPQTRGRAASAAHSQLWGSTGHGPSGSRAGTGTGELPLSTPMAVKMELLPGHTHHSTSTPARSFPKAAALRVQPCQQHWGTEAVLTQLLFPQSAPNPHLHTHVWEKPPLLLTFLKV